MNNTNSPNKNHLIGQMIEKSNEELLEILKNKNNFDSDTFEAAINAATERNLADA